MGLAYDEFLEIAMLVAWVAGVERTPLWAVASEKAVDLGCSQ